MSSPKMEDFMSQWNLTLLQKIPLTLQKTRSCVEMQVLEVYGQKAC